MKNYDILIFFVVLRLLSIIFVQTWYVPDEYWQSLEVAHNLVFGYGYLTWEWISGIRSYFYPLTISLVYKTLQVAHLDYPLALIYIPRILQALLSAYSDFCFYKWSGKRKWALFCISVAWFWFYTASRSLINSFELALTTIALTNFPWAGKQSEDNSKFLWIVAFLVLARPTAAIQWLPLCVYHILISGQTFIQIAKEYCKVGVTMVVFSILVDSLAHGKFIVTSYEFLRANVVNNVGTWYGVHSWYWYLSEGIPVILGVFIIPFTLAVIDIVRYRSVHKNELALLGCLVFSIFVYSLLPHKEFRFILPLLPIMLKVTADFLANWSHKANSFLVWLAAGMILISNAIPCWYFSMVHQRGSLDVMGHLREIAYTNPHNTSFLFLMPCHTTPYYSHIHVNVTMKFLTCEPNFKNEINYMDEADQFYSNPNLWFQKNYPTNSTYPSHIIGFNMLSDFILSATNRYRPVHTIFHTKYGGRHVGQHIIIYEKNY